MDHSTKWRLGLGIITTGIVLTAVGASIAIHSSPMDNPVEKLLDETVNDFNTGLEKNIEFWTSRDPVLLAAWCLSAATLVIATMFWLGRKRK